MLVLADEGKPYTLTLKVDADPSRNTGITIRRIMDAGDLQINKMKLRRKVPAQVTPNTETERG